MRIIKKWEELKEITENLIINIGNYDGVHIGHQELINEGIELSNGKKFALLTFNPHPKHFFDPINFKRITTKEEMKNILLDLDIDYWLDLPFNYKVAKLSPSDFLDLIINSLKIDHVIVGFNFKFGYKASGDVNFLKNYLSKKKIGLSVHQAVTFEGEKVSSTLIRELLVNGQVKKANQLMKRPYCISGIVEKGMGRGKKLGFPTANLGVEKIKLLPKNGVYAGYTDRGELAAINIGQNPTFDNRSQTVEVHIIDILRNSNLYDKKLTIYLTEFLRDDIKFTNLNHLVNQISKDVESIKKLNIKQQTFTSKN